MSQIPPNPRAVAAVILEKCDYDVDRAKSIARQMLAKPEYDQMREVLWHSAIDLELDQLWRAGRPVRLKEMVRGRELLTLPTRRQSTKTLQAGEVSVPNAAMTAALGRRTAGMMDFEMPNGTHIRDWTKRQLLEHGRKVVSNGQSTLRTGYFFVTVGEMLPKDDSVVGKVLTEVDLERAARSQLLIA